MAKRLKKAGFPQGNCESQYAEQGYIVHNKSMTNIADAPSEKEMMEHLKNYIDEMYWDDMEWNILLKPKPDFTHILLQNIDLTECLTLAIEAVAGRK